MAGAHSARPDSNKRPEGTPLSGAALRRRLQTAGLLDAVHGETDATLNTLTIDGLTDDSRAVEPGGAFVAIRGEAADGHSFIDMAVERGARLVVCEAVPKQAHERFPGAVFARVTDTRAALAEMAAARYGDPADALRLVGVTGTNGKTTVAYLLHHLLRALGVRTGLLSTIEVRTGAETAKMDLTTPGPIALHRTLRQMVDAGCTACTMEVSSHALAQKRVHGLDYETALFTNLSTDHLDYHGSPEAYRAAKKRLFDGLGPDATAVCNADDEAGPAMVADTAASVVSYALEARRTWRWTSSRAASRACACASTAESAGSGWRGASTRTTWRPRTGPEGRSALGETRCSMRWPRHRRCRAASSRFASQRAPR